MTINNSRSVFGERQSRQSFQEPDQVVITKPAWGNVVLPELNPQLGIKSSAERTQGTPHSVGHLA
jgi:hypothetical protein